MKGSNTAGADRTLGKKRRMLGMTQHDLSRQTDIPVGRIVFAETGRADYTEAERERVRTAFRRRAAKAMDAVSG